MSRILITTDDHDFVIFDLETETLTHKQGPTEELVCTHLLGQHRHPFRPFGIAEDQDSIFIASNDRLGKFNKTTFEFEKLIDVPLWINTHQVIKVENVIYACNTAIDTIGIYDLDTKENKQLSLNYMNVIEQTLKPRYAEELDSRHINSVYDGGDRVWFVRHNGGIIPSDIGFFDKQTLRPQILLSIGNSCHGIRIVDKTLYTLSTKTGELLSIDLNTLAVEKFKLVDPEVTFLRGLDYFDEKLVIGCSVNFKSKCSNPNSYIIVIDMKTIAYKNYILDDIKIINDLKIIT